MIFTRRILCGLITIVTLAGFVILPAWEISAEELGEPVAATEEGNNLEDEVCLEALPQYPDAGVSVGELYMYYALNGKEVGFYNLKPGVVYYMYYLSPTPDVFAKQDNFVIVDKVWEEPRGGLFGLFGDFTRRTIQFKDVITGETCYNWPLGMGVRFYEVERINNLTEPNLINQFS